MTERWTPVAQLADMGPTRRLVCRVAERDILLVRAGADVLAVDNRCTHLDQPLDQGRVMAGQITCPFHGACFDLRTGEAVSGPAVSPLRCYPARIQDGVVELKLDA